MKKYINQINMCLLCLLCIGCLNQSHAQQISAMEYFFDTDPGFGNGIVIPVVPDTSIHNLHPTIDFSLVQRGFHTIYIRSKDDAGHWSLTNRSSFYKSGFPIDHTIHAITAIEYFFDTDPGFGNGIQLPVTADTTVNSLTNNINLLGLSSGNHTLYIRSKDAVGKWSLTNRSDFTYCTSGTTTYYLDADGDGYGNVAQTITACSLPSGYSSNSLDCDDMNNAINPGATEICNGIDDNCDGFVDTIKINGLTMYLPLNGNANDMSGNQHNAIDYNCALSTGHTGLANHAYDFNGSSSRMDVSSHADLTPVNFTLSGWLFYNSAPTGIQAVLNKPLCSSWTDSYGIWFENGNLRFGLSGSTSSMESYAFAIPSTGVWHHVAMTFDDNANQVRIYIDNILKGTYFTTTSILYDNTPFIIGGEYENCNLQFYFNGKIDEVSFFNRALTSTEISTLYTNSPLESLFYPFYADADQDGYGAGNAVMFCAPNASTPPAGYSIVSTDCNDNDSMLHSSFPFYVDADGDGYGIQPAVLLCSSSANLPPSGYSVKADDCDDTNANVYPGTTDKIEYFIDTDPSVGQGTSIVLTPSNLDSVSASMSINIPANFATGHHVLSTRAHTCNLGWGLFDHGSFYVTPASVATGPLVLGELFFDTDPGLGNGIAFAVPMTDTINQNLPIQIPKTTIPGLHTFGIRLKDSLGQWSHFQHGNVTVLPPQIEFPPIIAAEYFIDTDPGLGNGSPLNVTMSDTLNQTFSIAIPINLNAGHHLLAIRVKDTMGKWGLFENRLFYVDDPGPAYNPIVAAEYIIDTDPGIGNGTAFAINTADTVDQNLTLSIPSSLLTGAHKIAFRVKAMNGLWSHFELPSIPINIKAIVQGYYDHQGLMHPVLMNQGQLNSADQTDTMYVDIHQSNPPYNVMYSTSAVLQLNGDLNVHIPNGYQGQLFYVGLRHRNSVETWSANPLFMNLYNNAYDFTTSSSKAYGSNMVEVDNGIWALYSGDVNQDENVDLLDLTSIENAINEFQFGYYSTDINGDGNVDLLDAPIVEANINNFVFSNHP